MGVFWGHLEGPSRSQGWWLKSYFENDFWMFFWGGFGFSFQIGLNVTQQNNLTLKVEGLIVLTLFSYGYFSMKEGVGTINLANQAL